MKTINLLNILFLFVLLGCNQDYEQESKPANSNAKKVTLKSIELVNDPISIYGSGPLQSEAEIALSFKTSGIVASINVNEGDYVKKGDLIAALDLSEIEAKVTQAKNSFDKAVRDLSRVENLYKDSVATLEQKQNAETALDVAEAELKIAEFNLKHSRIYAPVTGKILSKSIEAQELVGPSQPAFVLGSSSAGDQVIKLGLSDKDIVKVKPGDSAIVHFDAIPGKSYKAKVSEIAEAANQRTGTYNIKLRLTGKYHHELKIGFTAKVELFTSAESFYYKIPLAAMIEGDKKQASVYLTSDKHTVTKKLLSISDLQGDFFTASKNELDPTEWIVIEGAAYLNEKDSIIAIN